MEQGLLIIGALGLIALGAWHTRRWLPFHLKEARIFDFKEAPFCIEKDTGAIRVKNSTVVLRRSMSQPDFLKSDLYQHTTTARYFPLKNGLGHSFLVSFRDSRFENVYLRLSFENERLGCVDLGWGPQVSVAEWTEQRIHSDVTRYRAFLIRELGAIGQFPCRFPWGTVYAARDDKAGAPAMGIRYSGFEFASPSTPAFHKRDGQGNEVK